MKKIGTLICLMSGAVLSFALGSEPAFRSVKKEGNVVTETLYSADSTKLSATQYSDYDKKVKVDVVTNGGITTKTTYWENGNVKHITRYSDYENKVKHGVAEAYYSNGALRARINWNKGDYDGDLTTYYKNGAKKRYDVYKKGKLIAGKCWNEQGNEIPYFPFSKKPTYGNSENDRMEYFHENYNWPEHDDVDVLSIKIHFRVEKDGSLSNIHATTQNSNSKYKPYLEEAERLVKGMGKWNPAVVEGDVVSMNHVWPIRLRRPSNFFGNSSRNRNSINNSRNNFPRNRFR